MSPISESHVVAIVGGATAGAEAAGIFASRRMSVVVFEQNARPYGKIEDGLPRWHVKLRQKEYEAINGNLDRPGIHFVPQTRIGRDIDFADLVRNWGFSAVVLAHGAWRDRPLPVEGADDFVGRGLVYQNPFIYWFNHFEERGYSGPRYDACDGALVVGGGLASIDVLKVLQIETVRRELARRGIEEDMLHIEHEGVVPLLTRHNSSMEALGLRGATLIYRRRIEDMPLAEMPEGADLAKQQKAEAVRRRILEKAMQKYGFQVRPQRVPMGMLVQDGQLAGLRCQETRVEEGRAVPIDGKVEEFRAPLVISSIGSIPEPVRGIPQDGALYRYADAALGRLEGYDNVFCIGNVITGKGNINASRRHSIEVTEQLVNGFLGLDGGAHEREGELLEAPGDINAAASKKVADWLRDRPVSGPEKSAAILERVRERQKAVGYDGNYRAWIRRVTPDGLA